MGRILTTGFELQSLTAGVEFDAIVNADSRVSLETSAPISGAACLKYLQTSGTDTGSYVRRDITAIAIGRTYYLRFNFKFHTLPANTDGAVFIAIMCSNDDNYYGAGIALTTAGKLQLLDSYNSAQIGSDSATLSADVVYTIELSNIYANAATARLNGSQFATGSVTGSDGTNAIYLGHLLMGANSTTAGEWYIDDVAVNDDQGSYQNTYPGSGKVIMLRPHI